jgi:hypothetical protein
VGGGETPAIHLRLLAVEAEIGAKSCEQLRAVLILLSATEGME